MINSLAVFHYQRNAKNAHSFSDANRKMRVRHSCFYIYLLTIVIAPSQMKSEGNLFYHHHYYYYYFISILLIANSLQQI